MITPIAISVNYLLQHFFFKLNLQMKILNSEQVKGFKDIWSNALAYKRTKLSQIAINFWLFLT